MNYLEEMFWVPFPTVSSQVVYDLPSAVQLEKLKVQEAKEFFHLGMSGSRLPTPPFSWILSMLACIGTTFFPCHQRVSSPVASTGRLRHSDLVLKAPERLGGAELLITEKSTNASEKTLI